MKSIYVKNVFRLCMLFLLLSAAPAMNSRAATVNMDVEVRFDQTSARSMLDSINEFRQGQDAWAWDSENKNKVYYSNLGTLTYDAELEKAAMQRAAEIALLFAHTRPNGQTCYTAGGLDGSSNGVYGLAAGENIAAGNSTAQATFVQWREDNKQYSGQGHRRNMLSSDFTTIGIGHVIFNGKHYWVQEFGSQENNGSLQNLDATEQRTIEIDESFIDSKEISLAGQNTSVSIPYLSDDREVPEVKTAVYLKYTKVNSDGSSTTYTSWPGMAPVITDLTWTSDAPSVVDLDSSTKPVRLKGIKTGGTSIRTSFLGQELEVPVTVTPLSIKDYSVSAGGVTYTGKAQTPDVTVSSGGKILEADKDYTVAYKDNTDAGPATVTVTGIGNYTDTAETTFTILARDIKDAKVSQPANATYTGQNIEPDISVVYDGRTLQAGTDYKITYQNNKDAGTAKALIEGQGNFEASVEKTFTISPADLTKYELQAIPDEEYTGSEIKPEPVIKDLPEGATYKVSYQNNIQAGTATVSVTGVKNCSGTLTAHFIIKQKTNPVATSTTKSAQKIRTRNKTIILKAVKLKKKPVTVKPMKIISGNTAKTRISYRLVAVKKAKFKKFFKVGKNGQIIVKKGLKKGNYRLTLQAAAAETDAFRAAKKNFVVLIKVK